MKNSFDLYWHGYRYYPYERELAKREVEALLSPERLTATSAGLRVNGTIEADAAQRLVYFSAFGTAGLTTPTLQAKLERVNGNSAGRQSTRYSVHGLHEYKGKFNPQVVRALLNLLQVQKNALVLDPFCGSGTSLVESAHQGFRGVGLDLNPLAVFVANAKLRALRLPPRELRAALHAALRSAVRRSAVRSVEDERREYLARWFEPRRLEELERLRLAINAGDASCASVLLCIASDLLRTYSLQDPNDLRIRRRKTAPPTTSFLEHFEVATTTFLAKLEAAQLALGPVRVRGRAVLLDSRVAVAGKHGIPREQFDCALTSPPYATALPYIDTQRLSLVWLGLLPPDEILSLESELVGSRELRGGAKGHALDQLETNAADLPRQQIAYCRELARALGPSDGFRRQAVPKLLYRYFSDMGQAFASIKKLMKPNAPFALIVGHNHTVLGGRRFDINTPQHLASIAEHRGWRVDEVVPLQTYQRYGYHMNNAVKAESLLILRRA